MHNLLSTQMYVGRVTLRRTNGTPSRTKCVVNGHRSKSSSKRVRFRFPTSLPLRRPLPCSGVGLSVICDMSLIEYVEFMI